MKPLRVVLTVLLSACSLLSACGSDTKCQAISIGTDAGPTSICASTGTTLQTCCTSSHALGNTDQGQCHYIVDGPDGGTSVPNLPKFFQCEGANCVKAAQDVKNFCGAQ